jgi:hypothetical protein
VLCGVVQVTGDDGQTYAMTALHSHVSQRTWALHRTIREAIYGVVKQGSRLTQDGDVWVRDSEERRGEGGEGGVSLD